MTRMVKEKGYRLAENPRWFEEELEPGIPGNLRLDLYIEIASHWNTHSDSKNLDKWQ